jgi:RNA polymerase sigma-70 factor (ECF subfamily)
MKHSEPQNYYSSERFQAFFRLIYEASGSLIFERRNNLDRGADNYRIFLKGDETGLVEIIGEYREGLILFVNGIVHNMHDAEDIAEDTFVRLIVKKPRFSGNSSFKTWLYAIARNMAIDHLKDINDYRMLTMSDCDKVNYVEQDVESAYIKDEKNLHLHNIIKTLPDDYRQVLYLIYFENFDNSSVAKIMKKNKRQIVNLVYRAKKALKAKLMKEGFDNENK